MIQKTALAIGLALAMGSASASSVLTFGPTANSLEAHPITQQIGNSQFDAGGLNGVLTGVRLIVTTAVRWDYDIARCLDTNCFSDPTVTGSIDFEFSGLGLLDFNMNPSGINAPVTPTPLPFFLSSVSAPQSYDIDASFWASLTGTGNFVLECTSKDATLTASGGAELSNIEVSASCNAEIQYTYREVDTNPTPEPGTIALFGLALAGLGLTMRRRRAEA